MSEEAATGAALQVPTFGETLTDALLLRGRETPGKAHLHLRQEDGAVETITFGELLNGSATAAASLRRLGLKPGETVALMLPTCKEFFFSYLGTLLAGGTPVPIYPPMNVKQIQEYARRQAAILRNAEVRLLVTFQEAEMLARLLRPQIPSLRAVVSAQVLHTGLVAGPALDFQPSPDDVALIQYTSGSTGEPKGVVLTQRNLVANVRAIGHGVGVRPDDVVISWLPLYHDMGLIGCWLFSIYFGLELAALSPLAFLRRPERWLWMFHHHRGTLSPAPNFGYELCARKVSDAALHGLNLSSWRVALNGAEPIIPETLDRFTQRFAPYGFRAETMMPVYGLAECSVALSFWKRQTAPRFDIVDRLEFEQHGRARPASPLESATLRFVTVGRPLPEHDLRVVNHDGKPVGERTEGHIQFRGPSATSGYYRNAKATESLRDGAWTRTGDLGYIAEGDMFITGRTKDLIIQAGRNIHPQEVEKLVAEVDGVRRGCVAAFSLPNPATGSESLVIVAETRETKGEKRRQIIAEVKRRVGAGAISPDVVHLVPPHALPKTPSGKLQRDQTRRMYLQNRLTGAHPPVWIQVARLAGQAALATVRRLVGSKG